MAALTPHDEYILKAYGVSDQEINAYKYGTADAAIKEHINQVLIAVGSATGQPSGDRTRELPDIMKTLTPGSLLGTANRLDLANKGQPPFGGQYPWNMGGTIRSDASTRNITDIGGGLPQLPPRQSIASTTFSTPTGLPNPFGPSDDSIPNIRRSFPVVPAVDPGTDSSVSARQSSPVGNSSSLDNGSGIPLGPRPPDPGAYPSYPDIPPLDIPAIIAKNFTPEATKDINGIFAPLFQSVDAAKTNTRQQGDINAQKTSGAFANAIRDIANAATQTDQRYQGSEAQTKQQGAQVGQDIANDFMANNADVAKTLASEGLGVAAGPGLQQNANDASFLQGQNNIDVQAMQNYLEKQRQADASYATDVQNTTRGQGASAIADLQNNVGQNIFQLDQQGLGYHSDAAAAIVQLAQQMQNTDIGVQTTNAGNVAQEYDANARNLQNKYGAQTNKYDAAVAAIDSYLKNMQWEATFRQTGDRDLANAAIAAGAAGSAGASGTGAGTVKPPETPPIDNLRNYYNTIPGGGQAFESVFAQMTSFFNPDHPDDPTNFSQAREKVRNMATLNGLNQDLADRIFTDLYNQIYGKAGGGNAGASGG